MGVLFVECGKFVWEASGSKRMVLVILSSLA